MADNTFDITHWRQGDVCLDIESLPFLASTDEFQEMPAKGAVLLTQTCDIVRSAEQRPFVQVAALIQAPNNDIESIRRFQRPRYAFVPSVASEGLVADLDIIVTLDKSAITEWRRTEGCRTPGEQRDFSHAVGRHKNRFAFPDECTMRLKKLRSWVQKKGKTASEDGEFLQAIEQFRMRADDFSAPTEAEFICILSDGWTMEQRSAWTVSVIPKMESLVADWCQKSSFRLMSIEEISLLEYRETYRLDFEALTISA